MLQSRPRRAVICDHDSLLRHTLGDLIAEAGFQVVGETANIIQALQQIPPLQATLLVVTTESLVLNPIEILSDLRQDDPPVEIIVIAPDDAARDHVCSLGAFDLILHGDAEGLASAAEGVAHLLDTGERRTRPDRRSGQERRERQDWAKVITQRRSGADRRLGSRRTGDG